jgi:hypothetical protein
MTLVFVVLVFFLFIIAAMLILRNFMSSKYNKTDREFYDEYNQE